MITIASFFATACVFDKLSIIIMDSLSKTQAVSIMLVCLPACEHLPVSGLSDNQSVM